MIGLHIPEQQDDDPRQRIAEAMLMAQNSIPAGMQKHYIDQKLFGTEKKAPSEPQGQSFKGQVGMTTMTPEQEAKLRVQLRELRPNLPQSAYDDMVAAHKAAKGLR